MSDKRETYFASAERSTDKELERDITFVANSALVDGILKTVGGMFVVLNDKRQIVAINDEMLKALGIEEVKKVFGMRLGEAIKCIYSHDMPGGCGTSEYCSTCGATIAIVTTLDKITGVEKDCSITIEQSGGKSDIYLRVKTAPLEYNGRTFCLVFMQDLTYFKRWAALEQVFFHDISNIVSSLLCTSELLWEQQKDKDGNLSSELMRMSSYLANEVSMQRMLVNMERDVYRPDMRVIAVKDVVNELFAMYSNHASAKEKKVSIAPVPEAYISTDRYMILRVLGNMLVNAFEASEPGESVGLSVEVVDGEVMLCVTNNAVIPEPLTKRIFQRNFSTKSEIGRGIGTYSMKLFGEEFLDGKVGFTSRKGEGTKFFISLKAADKSA
ncbi:MAG: HAMP domain-containing histidine kinase [Deltaproteobacteria bacterium]|nr:HAMP domain-containing histidine kinase [Deltaproteobacteria bacterium]